MLTFLLFLAFIFPQYNSQEWSSITSFLTPNSIAISDEGFIYSSTSGGLLKFSPSSKKFTFIKEEEGLGIGDAKLLAAIGSNLGLQAIPMILLFTSLIGILIGLFYYKNSNQKSLFKLSIPLAPSLSISYVLYLLIN